MLLRSNSSSDPRASSVAVLVLEKLARGVRRKVAPVISQQPEGGKKDLLQH